VFFIIKPSLIIGHIFNGPQENILSLFGIRKYGKSNYPLGVIMDFSAPFFLQAAMRLTIFLELIISVES
jgi:hypothetical protein